MRRKINKINKHIIFTEDLYNGGSLQFIKGKKYNIDSIKNKDYCIISETGINTYISEKEISGSILLDIFENDISL